MAKLMYNTPQSTKRQEQHTFTTKHVTFSTQQIAQQSDTVLVCTQTELDTSYGGTESGTRYVERSRRTAAGGGVSYKSAFTQTVH